MSINFKTPNILSPEQWVAGNSTGIGMWSVNQSVDGENLILNDTDPWGGTSVVWGTYPSGDRNADGGWNSWAFAVDKTQLYRFSVWVRRTSSTGGGIFYFGTQEVYQLDGTDNTNPYFHCSSPSSLTQNQWYLFVAHVFPYTYSSTQGHPDTGVYTVSGGLVGQVNGCSINFTDAKHTPTTTTQTHRTYHYYCSDNTTRLQFYYPRVELCDGSQMPVANLLTNPSSYNILNTTSISKEGAAYKNQKVVATGGDVIFNLGDWRIHRFNNSGTFTLTSAAIGSTLSIEYLIVAGGGGGGMNMGGGGGGGGVIAGTTKIPTGTYTITVGAGGSGAPAGTGGQSTVVGTVGGNSSFNGLTAIGGGYGGISPSSMGNANGHSGGSGGGASGYNDNGSVSLAGGAGTSGQGYRGGNQGSAYYSGGGGGAGGAGTDGNAQPNGGPGILNTILGVPYYWAGGGGGASYSLSTGGNGGIGGGGGGALGYTTGGHNAVTWGYQGTYGACCSWANVPGGPGGQYSGGGGGGGSHYNATNAGGNGGSGIVVIRYKIK